MIRILILRYKTCKEAYIIGGCCAKYLEKERKKKDFAAIFYT